jgi:integrase
MSSSKSVADRWYVKRSDGERVKSARYGQGLRYRARYRDEGGKEHARHFARKVDAQQWLDQVTAAVVTGQYVDPKASRTTVREYATGWEAAHVGRDGTARVVDNALRVHLLPKLGDMPLGSLRRGHVQAVVKTMSETHSPATVSLVYGVLSRLLTAAVDDRLITSSPCRRIALPKATAGEVAPPTVEQVQAMTTAMSERYRAAVVMLAGSGLRIGELLGLDVEHVDFLRRTVRVERQRTQAGVIGPPKTATSVRTVPLGQVVIDALAAHLVTYPSTGPLFCEPDGCPLTYRRWRTLWDAARAEAKLEVGTHDLRHFFASALIAGGASVKQVQTTLGHASAVITLQTYAHLWPGDDDRTRTVIDATLAPLATTPTEEIAQ